MAVLGGLNGGKGAEEGGEGGGGGGVVVALVYIAGFALLEGQSCLGCFREVVQEETVGDVFDIAGNGTMVLRDGVKTLRLRGVGSVLYDAGDEKEKLESELNTEKEKEREINEYLDSLCRWNGEGMMKPLAAGRAAWRDVPKVVYIHTTDDQMIPLREQEFMVEAMEGGREGRGVRRFTVESGHCPYFTATGEVVDMIVGVVDGLGTD